MPLFPSVRRLLRIAAAALASLILAGCLGFVPSPFRPSPGPVKGAQVHDLAEAFDVVCRNYRLGPDDVLQVIFQTEWSIPAGSYRLDTLDVVEVEFIFDPELNRKVVIRPDGMITLPGIGEVAAAGLSPDDLAGKIEKKYRKANIFRNGDADRRAGNYKPVTVSVVNFYEKIKKLVESLTTLTNGQQTQITVKPDGTIDLPLLKDRVIAVGFTVGEVEHTVNRLYRGGPLKHVVASVSLATARSRKVYVLGEVERPGAYDIKQPINALHAIALAGGHRTATADLTSVILISKDVHGKPIGRRLDLKRMLDAGDMSDAILTKPYDVIFVPKTYVADLGLFMRQYFLNAAAVAAFVDTLLDIKDKQ